MFSPYIQMPLRFHAFENVIARGYSPPERGRIAVCLSFADRGLQNMHQHVAAFVRFQFQQLFLFQRAQHVREAPQADLPFGEVGIIRLHRRFENGWIHPVKAVLLVFREDARENADIVLPRDLLPAVTCGWLSDTMTLNCSLSTLNAPNCWESRAISLPKVEKPTLFSEKFGSGAAARS